MTQNSRRLLWGGCANVRDLGGHAAEDGGVTRSGSLIRSDNLARLTLEGQEAVKTGGVSTIIDVRSPFELDIEANPFAQASAADAPNYRNLPLMDEADAEGQALINAAPTVTEMYRLMLDRFRANMGVIMLGIADAPSGAVVIHCHAGKDRTGLVVALALRLVGVSKDQIAEDYTLSDLYLSDLYQELLAKKSDPGERALLAEQLSSKPEAILGALSHLDEHYGGVEAYLLGCGLETEAIGRLRSRLLASAPTA